MNRFTIASFITSDKKVLEFELERVEQMYIKMCIVGFILLIIALIFLKG